MKITYKFADDTTSEVEVSEEVGTVIMDSRRREETDERRHRYHCWSLDAISYEGEEYGTADFTDAMFDGSDERAARVREAFSHLTETQQRRMLMLAAGLSEREIARREGKDYKSVHDSIEAARKKFLKYF
mgnify:CR=1 FL=1